MEIPDEQLVDIGNLYTRWVYRANKRRRVKDKRVLCPEWQGPLGFAAFVKWSLANGFRRDLVLDRRDNTCWVYSPENCRWVTHEENANNR